MTTLVCPAGDAAQLSLEERFAAMQAQLDSVSAKLSSTLHVGEPWDWSHTDNAKLSIPPEWTAHIFQGAAAPVQQHESYCALISALVWRVNFSENQRLVDRRKLEELEKEQSWYVRHRRAMEDRMQEMQKFLALPAMEAGKLSGVRPMTTVEAEKLKAGLEAIKNGDEKLKIVCEIMGRSATVDGVVEVDIEKTTIDQRWRLYFLVSGLKLKRSLSTPGGTRKQAKSPTPHRVSVSSFGGATSFADSPLLHEAPPPEAGEEQDEFSIGGF